MPIKHLWDPFKINDTKISPEYFVLGDQRQVEKETDGLRKNIWLAVKFFQLLKIFFFWLCNKILSLFRTAFIYLLFVLFMFVFISLPRRSPRRTWSFHSYSLEFVYIFVYILLRFEITLNGTGRIHGVRLTLTKKTFGNGK